MKLRLGIGHRLPDSLKKGLVLLAWVALAGGLMGSAFLASFLVAMRSEMRSNAVQIPALSGLTLDEAQQRVLPQELVLEVVDRRNDPRIQSGRVLEQMPPAGASVRRGRKVRLVISLGGKVLSVPEIVGQPSRAVAIELTQGGFRPGDEAHVYSYDHPSGQVVAQDPAAGTTAVPSSRVHRLVSSGPPPTFWVMPDLRGMSQQSAERWVVASGFRVGRIRKGLAQTGLPGTVIGHQPLSGYPIRTKAVVELTVAE